MNEVTPTLEKGSEEEGGGGGVGGEGEEEEEEEEEEGEEDEVLDRKTNILYFHVAKLHMFSISRAKYEF